jgi:surface antigen
MKGSMKSDLRAAILVLLVVATPWAVAGSGGWVAILKNTPAEQFDDEDLKMFLAAAGNALNAEATPPQPVVWSNPDTGSGGRFLELRRSTLSGGAPCKRMKVSTYAKNRSEQSVTYTLCKNAAGKWQLSSGS